MSKKIFLVIGLVLFGAVSLGYWHFFENEPEAQKAAERELSQLGSERVADDTTIRLIATGDTIAHDSINAAAEQSDGSYDYYQLMNNMQPFFDGADIRFCNQATPAGGEEFEITGYPVFNAPFEFTQDMVKLGCNVVNTGTNHTYDKGQPLIDAMVEEWDKQDVLAHAGANSSGEDKTTVKYFEIKGVKFAFLAYSTYSNKPITNGYGITEYSRELASNQLKEASEKADISIVSMRWGTEYSAGINKLQDRISQELADMGADVVLGHGPHVLEPVKKIKGSGGNQTIVWYSLGNFLNTQLDVESLTGIIAVMDIDTSTKNIKITGAMPIYNHYEWTAEQKQAQDLLARKNIEMYPLDQSADELKRSQHNTAPQAQTARIKGILNEFLPVPIIKSTEY